MKNAPMQMKMMKIRSTFALRAIGLLSALAMVLVAAWPAQAQNPHEPAAPPPAPVSNAAPPDAASLAPPPPGLMDRVIANQKKVDAALLVYERIERVESRRDDNARPEVKVSRVVPAGTGTDHIPLGPDGAPADPRSYREALEKLAKSLAWAAKPGEEQASAYAKAEKKRKERDALIDETRKAFLFTFEGREPRGSRMLAKFRMEPNPAYKATSRETAFFAKVRGHVWVDEQASQLAKIEGEVTEDISIGIFLAKVYKGSYFMQERYELRPGVWLPTFSQYDFDGRKFFVTFAVHERAFYSNYRRVGPPAEALQVIRAELAAPRPPVPAMPATGTDGPGPVGSPPQHSAPQSDPHSGSQPDLQPDSQSNPQTGLRSGAQPPAAAPSARPDDAPLDTPAAPAPNR